MSEPLQSNTNKVEADDSQGNLQQRENEEKHHVQPPIVNEESLKPIDEQPIENLQQKSIPIIEISDNKNEMEEELPQPDLNAGKKSPIKQDHKIASLNGNGGENAHDNIQNMEKKNNVLQNQNEQQNGLDNDEDQDEEDQGDDEDDDDSKIPGSKSKRMRKGSSDSIRESHQENDTSQLQATGGKKCFNRLCPSKKIFRKIRSKVQAQRYRFLCKSCYDNYVNNSFCQFCEQIYSNYQNQQEDMNKWVGCDKCQRWNHIECQKKYRHKSFQINNNTHYECLACSKKSRTNLSSLQPGEVDQNKRAGTKPERTIGEYESTRNYRPKFEINKEDKIPIFHKKVENFPCLEQFLQTYNFRIWINENNIREDIQSLRSLNRRPPMEEEQKKVKKIKQQ